MFADALAMYAQLDPAIPSDPVLLGASGTFNNNGTWVLQSTIAGTNPLAVCLTGFSSTPPCWIISNTIRVALDPTDGINPGCWEGQSFNASPSLDYSRRVANKKTST
jgi:hypothetical protein